MIGFAMSAIVSSLNAYMEQRVGVDGLVVLDRLVDEDGKFTQGDGKICCSMVSMEEERIVKHQMPSGDGLGFGANRNPDILVNLYLLFSVNAGASGSQDRSGKYLQGLHLLSMVVAFFQGKPIFDPQNTPDLHPGLKQVSMELHPLSIENQNHLWAGLGAKYIPSALYKLRLVAIRDEAVVGLAPLITDIHIEQGGMP